MQEQVVWVAQAVDGAVDDRTTDAAGSTYVTTTPDGQVISERLPNGSGGFTSYYYLHDGLGSVVGLTDGSGNVVNSYAYDPYGNATSVSEQVANPFRFDGAIYDSSTGLYKMGARYYDPTIGRFTQEDPAGMHYGNAASVSFLNSYVYAQDDPCSLSDPSGLHPRKHHGRGKHPRYDPRTRAVRQAISRCAAKGGSYAAGGAVVGSIFGAIAGGISGAELGPAGIVLGAEGGAAGGALVGAGQGFLVGCVAGILKIPLP